LKQLKWLFWITQQKSMYFRSQTINWRHTQNNIQQ